MADLPESVYVNIRRNRTDSILETAHGGSSLDVDMEWRGADPKIVLTVSGDEFSATLVLADVTARELACRLLDFTGVESD